MGKKRKPRNLKWILIAVLALIMLFFIRAVYATAGNVCPSASPCGCGAQCNGGYEVSNLYNTIDSCQDGNDPRYEYVHDINLTDLNDTTFSIGDVIAIDVYFDCDPDGDEFSFAYNNGSGWKNIHNGNCNYNGKMHFYKNLTLDNVVGNHTIRAITTYSGAVGMTCGYDYHIKYSDTDDLVFNVEGEPDLISPNITALNFPQNSSNIGAVPIDFNFTAQDDIMLSRCTLYGNFSGSWQAAKNVSNPQNNSIANITFSPSDGSFIWNIVCYDSGGNSDWFDANFSVNIDSTPPNVSFVAPTPANNTYQNITSVVINISIQEAHKDSIILNWNGTNETNTLSQSGIYWNITKNSLDGVYTYYVFVNDTFGHSNTTSVMSITIDNTPPGEFNLTSPANNTLAEGSNALSPYLNWSQPSELNFANYTIQVSEDSGFNAINYSYKINEIGNNSYNVPDVWANNATFYWRVIAFDLAGNNRASPVYYYRTNTSSPSIVLIQPAQNQWFNTAFVRMNYTPSDNNLDTCELWGTFLGIWQFNQADDSPVSGIANNFSSISLFEGDYNWNVRCNDTGGNVGWGPINFTVNIDLTPPSISFVSPTPNNNSIQADDSVVISVSIEEDNLEDIVLNWNGTNETNTLEFSDGFWSISKDSLDGTYNYYVSINDTASSINRTETRYVTVDIIPPNINNIAANPSSGAPNSVFNITANVTDNINVNSSLVEITYPNDTITNFIMLRDSDGVMYYEFTAMPAGDYFYVIYANDSVNNLEVSDIYNFSVDASPPTISNITYFPNTSEILDPLVRINVTARITDNINMSLAVLQYKEVNASSWTNSTMANISLNMYRGNFTPSTENNWTFRVVARDSSGNANTSSNTTIEVSYDYSWTASPPTAVVGAIKDTAGFNILNITINNTGDSSIAFNISKFSGTPDVSFNATQLTILSGGIGIVEVNATIPSVEAEYLIGILVDAVNESASPSAFQINITLAVYVSGPYLSVQILEYDSAVTQTDHFYLRGKITNIGNDTATNVSAGWTIPDDWSSRDDLELEIGNLSVGQYELYNISIDVDSSAAIGTVSIRLEANCTEGKYNSDSKSVTVSSSSPPDVQVITVNTGSGGGGGAVTIGGGQAAVHYNLSVDSPDKISILRNSAGSIPININNPVKNTILKDVKVAVEGYMASYIDVEPDSIREIAYGETKTFTLKITVPKYMRPQDYPLKIIISAIADELTVNGTGRGKDKIITEEKSLILTVQSATKEIAAQSIAEAEQNFKDMQNAGFNTDIAAKLIYDAKRLFEEGDYDSAVQICIEIFDIRKKAFSVNEQIEQLRKNIGDSKNKGIDVSAAQDMLNLAVEMFEKGDFDSADKFLAKALLAERIESKIEEAKAINRAIYYIREHYAQLTGLMIIMMLSAIFVMKKVKETGIANRLRDLQKEESAITELMRKAQRGHFKEKIMGEGLYKKSMAQYRQRMAKIHQSIINIESKRIKLLGSSNKMEELRNEQESITNLIKALQLRYFRGKSIGAEAYESALAEYKKGLAVINERIALLTEKEEKKKAQKSKPVEKTVKNAEKIIGKKPEVEIQKIVKEDKNESALEKLKAPPAEKIEAQPKVKAELKEKMISLEERAKQSSGPFKDKSKEAPIEKMPIEKMAIGLKKPEPELEKNVMEQKKEFVKVEIKTPPIGKIEVQALPKMDIMPEIKSISEKVKKNDEKAMPNGPSLFKKEVKPENYFWLKGVSAPLKSLQDLKDALKLMNNDIFLHHVSSARNDFSNWVKYCMDEKKLAEDIAGRTTKEGLLRLLEQNESKV